MESLAHRVARGERAGGTWVQQAKGGTLFLTHSPEPAKEAQNELVSVIRNNAHNFRLICASGSFPRPGASTELFYRGRRCRAPRAA